MEDYELESEAIIQWAMDFADYDDLEKTAKAIYGIYIRRRKVEKPAEQKKSKQRKKWVA